MDEILHGMFSGCWGTVEWTDHLGDPIGRLHSPKWGEPGKEITRLQGDVHVWAVGRWLEPGVFEMHRVFGSAPYPPPFTPCIAYVLKPR